MILKRILVVILFISFFSTAVEALNESMHDPMQKEKKMETSLGAFDQWWQQPSDLLPEEKMAQAYTYVRQFTPREQMSALELLKEKMTESSDEYKAYFDHHPLMNWLNALTVLNLAKLPTEIVSLARQNPVMAIEDCLAMPAEQQAKVIQLLTEAEQVITEKNKHLAALSNEETEMGDDISLFLLVFHTRQKQLKEIF